MWFNEIRSTAYNSSSECRDVIMELRSAERSAYCYRTCERCETCIDDFSRCGMSSNRCGLKGISPSWKIISGEPCKTSSESQIFCDQISGLTSMIFVPRKFFMMGSTRCIGCTSFQILN